ncbi:hypothetical protein E2C01_074573 [Portunus trituberculatus]|uniref:Uncharacterized protein n=1 Tax=Portunus trituberculatus TaxID=210409 RepID=A0A5B7I600_PORTR|nr:hypothetical protein [Portunus trituberculatus]
MTDEQFVDLQPLQSKCTKTQVAKSRYKEGRMFMYTEEYKQSMRIWQTYVDDKGRGAAYDLRNFDLTTIDLPVKYPQGVVLRPEKLADLNHLLSFIPHKYKPWYNDLFAAQGLLAAGAAEDNPEDPDTLEEDFLNY